MSWGKLEKLTIKSFTTPERQSGLFSFLVQTYQVMFNPESYGFKYENEYQKYQGINTAGRTARYAMTRSRTLNFKFIIDDSSATAGLLSGSPSLSLGPIVIHKTVHDRVEEFLDLAGRMDGSIHEPRYLTLEWGELSFDCRLQAVDINYTLFDRSGTAIRAELDATFVEDLDPEKLAKQSNKSSPDLTHTRTVTSSDTLPLMAYQIYRDPAYYVRVAQANKLNHLRGLKAGSTLNFPPIQTTDNR